MKKICKAIGRAAYYLAVTWCYLSAVIGLAFVIVWGGALYMLVSGRGGEEVNLVREFLNGLWFTPLVVGGVWFIVHCLQSYTEGR